MHITRIQVEEGFLDGLDVRFAPGLNTLIGARGTGKTSVIELIRFALGGSSFTLEASERSLAHATAILGSGEVTVTLANGEAGELSVSRSVADDRPRTSGSFNPVLVLSQTEIETLGTDPAGRLRLLDGFQSHESAAYKRTEAHLVSEISSLTSQLKDARQEIEQLASQVNTLPEVVRELESLRPAEIAVTQASEEAAAKAEELRRRSETTAQLSVTLDRHERFVTTSLRREAEVAAVLQRWGTDETADLHTQEVTEALSLSEAARRHLEGALKSLRRAREIAELHRHMLGSKRAEAETQARSLRQKIESIHHGAGVTARRTQHLRERIAQLTALRDLLEQRRKAAASVFARRAVALDDLERARHKRFLERQAIAEELNGRLGPRIRVSVEHAGQVSGYSALIAAAMRGSGIRYNELSQTIAHTVSPRELLEWAEGDDIIALAEAATIPRDRAARALAAVRDSDLADIGTYLVEDDVQLCLLDGVDHKQISELSLGQRCTVVLPIVLERRGAVIVVDQPEDHIDNAFIADTLIKALRDTSSGGQLIVSTHNANIPVLGNAATVTQMGSDGRRGYVLVCGPLDDDDVVAAITSVMEGGREAFRKRASFYAQHK